MSSKKGEEPSATDSGYQDSCEIQQSDGSQAFVNKTELSEGNSQRDDNACEKNDSGVFSRDSDALDTHNLLVNKTFIPKCYEEGYQRNTHPIISKFFERDEDGYTKLHIAILHKLYQAISSLCSLVPDSSFLNIRNISGHTALHLAVLEGQHQTVKMLIDAGADINIRDNRCNTALHLSCINREFECAQTIISAVKSFKDQNTLANLEQWNYEGETCFYIACKEQNINLMKALEKSGANVNAREGRSGYTALHKAIEMKATRVIEFLCEECKSLNIDVENYEGLTAFQLGLITEQEDIAAYLTSKGATPYFTLSDDDQSMEIDSADELLGEELEKINITNKMSEIAVN